MDLNLTEYDTIITDYYYADHDRKVVFFLDPLEAHDNLPIWVEVKGVNSLRHIREYMHLLCARLYRPWAFHSQVTKWKLNTGKCFPTFSRI